MTALTKSPSGHGRRLSSESGGLLPAMLLELDDGTEIDDEADEEE